MAKIFGELITLLEATKRQGAEDSLSVTLPYSRSEFSIPSNVYVLGTMNTADRSLTGLDLALRRRFAFAELEPDPDLLEGIRVAGVDISELLTTINDRLEQLLDRDHRLGHAALMKLTHDDSIEALARIFEGEVIPYLLELFFDRWDRVRLVLNDHRKPSFEDQFIVEAIDVVGLDIDGGDVRQRWRLNPAALLRPEAYLAIVESAG